MTRDAAFTELQGLGFSGSVEDMLYAYLGGTWALVDRVFISDPTVGGVTNFIMSVETFESNGFLLLESGDFFLLENGDKLILE